jgi:NAD(P)-dependent dehydrogenase (short-subunit alcohol dehydrogenase family)
MELRDRVAVVTGGANGIGRALARRFAAEGARGVVVADLDGDGAQAVADEIGGRAVRCDVADEAQIIALVDEALAAYGQLDVMASNAGIGVGGGPEAPNADWQRVWDVNFMPHVYAARAAVPAMRERGEGYLLGTVSAAALVNHIGAAPYAVTKSGALSFYEWLAIAHGDDGIAVSALCPQGVRTNMLAEEARTGRSMLQAGAIEPEQVAGTVVAAMRDETFLILPHAEVAEYVRRKADDYDRWLRGMRRLRDRVVQGEAG